MKRKSQLIVVCALVMVAGLVTIYGKLSYGKSSSATGLVLEWRIANVVDDFRGEPIPVEITQIAKDRKPIKFGEAFAASADALANASVTLRNVSNQEIRGLSLVLMLVDPRTNRPKAMSRSVNFNRKIAADGEATVVIDSHVINGLRRLSERTGVPLTQLRMAFDWVEFADSTRWMFGSIHLQDPEIPGNWYIKGTYDAYREHLKQKRQRGGAEYSKIGMQAFPCLYYVNTVFYNCDDGCTGQVFTENFTGFPIGGPKYNFDYVTVECPSGGCFRDNVIRVSLCP